MKISFTFAILSMVALTGFSCSEKSESSALVENATGESAAGGKVTNPVLPAVLHDSSGQSVDPADLSGKHVALYFSAHWCPPCRAFTPTLVKFRNEHADDDFEVVFVSLDNSEEEKETYIREMDMKWLNIPGAASPEAQELAGRFNIQGIPSLVVLSPDGAVVTVNGQEDVMTSPETALSKWKGIKTS